MEELIGSPFLIAGLFALVAGLYASVGLGGGSAYTALLAIFGVTYRLIPGISLTLNVVVTAGASLSFAREGHLRCGLIVPLLLASLPLSYAGGSIAVSERFFYWILLGALLLVAARIYLPGELSLDLDPGPTARRAVVMALGGGIGLVGGSVGIGGGIYLIPVLLLLDVATEKEAAAAGAVFTGLNSLTALAAHLQRRVPDFELMVPLLAAVLVGGLVGSHLGATRLSRSTIRRLLGIVILIAVALLAHRLIS